MNHNRTDSGVLLQRRATGGELQTIDFSGLRVSAISSKETLLYALAGTLICLLLFVGLWVGGGGW